MPDFSRLHPYTVLLYFLSVLVYSMVFMHPLFVAANVVLSFVACMCLCPRETAASIKYTIGFSMLIMLLNPFFSTGGETVLFTYFGRNYTLQALVYGAVMAGIFICSINWFSAMGKVISTEKFLFLFGGRFPNICTVLTMVMGLVPFFQKKLMEIDRAQGTIRQDKGFKNSFQSLNSAVSYAFEHAIGLSVSMKNRGFGSGRTTRFSDYRFRKYDFLTLFIILILNASVVANLFAYAVNIQLIPVIVLPVPGTEQLIGGICFFLLLLLPTAMYILKELQWQYLKSKI